MKISFFIKSRGKKIFQSQPSKVHYTEESYVCSVMIYGDTNNPQTLIADRELSPATAIKK